MASANSNGTLDVTQEIRLDHDNVRDLFQRFVGIVSLDIFRSTQSIPRFKAASDTQERKAIANTLVREMAIHSDAE